jgi:hypothetical protein
MKAAFARNVASLLACTVLSLAVTGCFDQTPEPAADTGSAVTLRVRTAERVVVREVGADTLSDSARIRRLLPEEDGEAIAIIFDDAGRGVHSALAVSDRGRGALHLLWPDSVTAVWWPGLHRLAFSTTTGERVRVVVDVHSESLELMEEASDSVPVMQADQPATPVSGAATARATAYVDSLRAQQPGEYAPQSGLRYAVDTLVASDDGVYVAFHVTATDRAGGETNPAWYMLHVRSGVIQEVDAVTGPPGEMPAGAAAWVRPGSFMYAKGLAIWEAEVSSDQLGG